MTIFVETYGELGVADTGVLFAHAASRMLSKSAGSVNFRMVDTMRRIPQHAEPFQGNILLSN